MLDFQNRVFKVTFNQITRISYVVRSNKKMKNKNKNLNQPYEHRGGLWRGRQGGLVGGGGMRSPKDQRVGSLWEEHVQMDKFSLVYMSSVHSKMDKKDT